MRNDFVYVEGTPPHFKSKLFIKHNIPHAFFTRNGGVSKGVFESLNFAVGTGTVTDSDENILKNHSIAAKLFGLTERDICRSYQTHTTVVETVTEADRGRGTVNPPYDHGVDGLVTDVEGLLLSVRSADCVPILLADKKSGICGAVHAGWRGTVGLIAENAVGKMVSLGAEKENIIAAIGPCIADCCYEVGGELYNEFVARDKEFGRFFTPSGEKYMLDLVGANGLVLVNAGVLPQNISSADICTKCHPEHFFSHRLTGANRGTMSAFVLKQK